MHALRAGRRAAIALALAVPGAGCGDDPVSPTAPDPVPPSPPTVEAFDIVGAPPGGLVVGYTANLRARLTYSNGVHLIAAAEWTSSAPALASVDADGALTAHAAGTVTVTARADGRRAAVAVEIRPPGPDETFWRQFAFNDYECSRGTETCLDLRARQLWRLPNPSPDFHLLADSLGPALVDRIRETIPRAVPQLTGDRYAGRIVAAPSAAQLPAGGASITIEGVGPRQTPTAPACRNIGTESFRCGKAYIGAERGCIVLNTNRRSCLTPSLIMHEIGHAFGFYHTADAADIMQPTALGGQRADYSPLEQHHGRFAYTQRRGARYADIALRGFGPRPPRRPPPRFDHGGIAVD